MTTQLHIIANLPEGCGVWENTLRRGVAEVIEKAATKTAHLSEQDIKYSILPATGDVEAAVNAIMLQISSRVEDALAAERYYCRDDEAPSKLKERIDFAGVDTRLHIDALIAAVHAEAKPVESVKTQKPEYRSLYVSAAGDEPDGEVLSRECHTDYEVVFADSVAGGVLYTLRLRKPEPAGDNPFQGMHLKACENWQEAENRAARSEKALRLIASGSVSVPGARVFLNNTGTWTRDNHELSGDNLYFTKIEDAILGEKSATIGDSDAS